MHEAALSQAALPAPVVILRLRMRPYSLGHELFMHRRENPIVILTEDAFNALPCEQQIAAVMEAALCGCQTWRENTTRPHRWLWLWSWLNRRANWPLEIAEFRNYRAAGMTAFPADLPRGEDTGSVRFLGCPEILSLYQHVLAHIPPSEWPGNRPSSIFHLRSSIAPCAWDFPFGLAKMHKQAADERDGGLEIYNYRQWVHDQGVAELVAAEEAKAKAAAATETPAENHPAIEKGGS